jgi:potassium efflux system protein
MNLERPLIVIGNTTATLGDLLLVAAVFVTTILVGRLVYRLIGHRIKQRHEYDAQDFKVYALIAKLIVWFIGFDVALHLLGFNLNSILAASGFLALGAGFASKNIIENFFAGLILRWEKTVRPGDILIVSGKWRVIKHIGVRATEATTHDGEDILMPNSLLTQSSIENLTRLDRSFRIDIKVGVAYDSDLSVVKQTIEDVIEKLEWRMKDKDSWVNLVEFGDLGINFEIAVWIAEANECVTRKAEAMEAIWLAFKENGITFAHREIDVHLDRT